MISVAQSAIDVEIAGHRIQVPDPAPVDAAHPVRAVNLGCLELNPWPVRPDHVDHPDEPPDFPKAKGGPRPVAPSRARKASS